MTSNTVFTLTALLAALSALAGESIPAVSQVPKEIRAYDIDFNWGPGGPNGFAQPGLWTDADPAKHVVWYRAMGANVIQTFCVSCNGYACALNRWRNSAPPPRKMRRFSHPLAFPWSALAPQYCP